LREKALAKLMLYPDLTSLEVLYIQGVQVLEYLKWSTSTINNLMLQYLHKYGEFLDTYDFFCK
jgi:hypothetical protein